MLLMLTDATGHVLSWVRAEVGAGFAQSVCGSPTRAHQERDSNAAPGRGLNAMYQDALVLFCLCPDMLYIATCIYMLCVCASRPVSFISVHQDLTPSCL